MLRVAADKSIRAALAKLAPDRQADVLAALRELPSAFGRPHAHAGIRLRQLRRGIFEARSGLQCRIVFERDGDLLVVKALGTHDEIRRFLRKRV